MFYYSKKAFTLIETIVVISIFSLIITSITSAIIILYRTYGYTKNQSMAIDRARRAVEVMIKEVRGIKTGDNGSYPIEKAGDKEFIFYSDIDGDGKTERIRYFLGTINSGTKIQECQTSTKGGTCSVNFSNFLKGNLVSAQLKISLDGDFGASNEYAEIFADETKLANICEAGCSDCPNAWQGTTVLDVTNQAFDNSILFLTKSTSQVDPQCPHSMKAKLELFWSENLPGFAHELRKGIIKPVVNPNGSIDYPSEQEKITILSPYVRNAPPIFEYFDQNGNKINENPARLIDTKLMKVFMVINVDPNRPPQDFELESYVQLRNLKSE